jgi:hypothetical protein
VAAVAVAKTALQAVQLLAVAELVKQQEQVRITVLPILVAAVAVEPVTVGLHTMVATAVQAL